MLYMKQLQNANPDIVNGYKAHTHKMIFNNFNFIR